MNNIISFPNKQVQWNFLYWIFRNKINHLQRTINPGSMKFFNQQYENMKRQIFNSIVGVDINDSQWIQACMSIKDGGFGLGFTLSTSNIAFIASCTSSYWYSNDIFPESFKHNLEIRNNQPLTAYDSWFDIYFLEVEFFKRQCVDVYDTSASCIDIETLIYDKSDTLKIQKNLQIIYDCQIKHQYSELITSFVERDQARSISTGGRHSGAFLRALHRGPFKMMSDDFDTTCLFRLGIAFPFISPNLRCDCKNKPLIGVYGEHFHCCNKKGWRLKKHDVYVQELIIMCGHASIDTQHEPLNCFPNNIDGIQPDMRLFQPNFPINNKHKHNNNLVNCAHDIVTDFSITHPATKTNIGHHSNTKRGASALEREKQKCSKYNAASKNNNLHFVPLVAESYGTLSERLIKFIYDVVRKIHEKKKKSRVSFAWLLEYWIMRLSVKLQVMNARMFMSRAMSLVGAKTLVNDEVRFNGAISDSRVRVPYVF